jgi:pyruvate/2-oxoglutarate dehydrogenase complex dihydrolipoamide acyltransferase (E2) component
MRKGSRLKGWRKIAGSTWRRPADPQIYGELELDAGALQAYIAKAKEHGVRLTVTHLIGRAAAHALAEHPDVNVRLRPGRSIPRDSVDVFFIVSTEDGRDLSGVKIRHADEKSAAEVSEELAQRSARVNAGDDDGLGKVKPVMDLLPVPVLRVVLRVAAWLTSDRDVDLSRFGMSRQAFGSAMVSSIGMFGIERAWAPLSPYYRVPFIVLVGEVASRPVAIEGTVQVRPRLSLGITMDHRYVDGHHAGRLARSVRDYCGDPERYEAPLPSVGP